MLRDEIEVCVLCAAARVASRVQCDRRFEDISRLTLSFSITT
jgi:hypothetical protein